jgi:preprotein translocase subunit SecE
VNDWKTILIWTAVVAAIFGYFWWKGQVRQLAFYIQETWVELKKCAWPNWNELKGSTVLIGITIILLGAFISVLDVIFNKIFTKVL